jgi:predicted metal-dependent hydrolase
MTISIEHIELDDLTIPIRRSVRRKSVGITVERDGSLLVSAPMETAYDKIDSYVRSKSLWIYKKLILRKSLNRDSPTKKVFVDGACLYYLGNSYRLKLVDKPEGDLTLPLTLHGDWFHLDRSGRSNAAMLFRRWYANQGLPVVTDLVREFATRIASPTAVEIRDIGFRWGSCTTDGKILISWRTVQLPAEILRYVVAHELVHLLHKNHGKEFWAHLHRVMPDYSRKKTWLAENGESYAAEF